MHLKIGRNQFYLDYEADLLHPLFLCHMALNDIQIVRGIT